MSDQKEQSAPVSKGNVVVQNVHGGVVTVGDHNLILASVKFYQVKEEEVNASGEQWKMVLEQITLLQKELVTISGEHEDLRDIELAPEIAQAKKMAKELENTPHTPKKPFIEKLAKISEVAGKIADVGAKVSPFILAIAKMLGISI